MNHLRFFFFFTLMAASAWAIAPTVYSGSLSLTASPGAFTIYGSSFSGENYGQYIQQSWSVISVYFSNGIVCGGRSVSEDSITCLSPSTASSCGSLTVQVCIFVDSYNDKTGETSSYEACDSNTVGEVRPYLATPSPTPQYAPPGAPALALTGAGFGAYGTCSVALSDGASCGVQSGGYTGTSLTCLVNKWPLTAGTITATVTCSSKVSATVNIAIITPYLTPASTAYPVTTSYIQFYGAAFFGGDASVTWYNPGTSAVANPTACSSLSHTATSGYSTCYFTSGGPTHAGEGIMTLYQEGYNTGQVKVVQFYPILSATSIYTPVAFNSPVLTIRGLGFGEWPAGLTVVLPASTGSLTYPTCTVTAVNNTAVVCSLSGPFEISGSINAYISYKLSGVNTVNSDSQIVTYIKPSVTLGTNTISAAATSITIYGNAFGTSVGYLSVELSSGACSPLGVGSHGAFISCTITQVPTCGPLSARVCYQTTYCSEMTQIYTVAPNIVVPSAQLVSASTFDFAYTGVGFSAGNSAMSGQIALISGGNPVQSVNCTVTDPTTTSFRCVAQDFTAWSVTGDLQLTLTCLGATYQRITHSVVTGLALVPSTRYLDYRATQFRVYGANMGGDSGNIQAFLNPAGQATVIDADVDNNYIAVQITGLTLGPLNMSIERTDVPDSRTEFVVVRTVVDIEVTIQPTPTRKINQLATEVTIIGQHFGFEPQFIWFDFYGGMEANGVTYANDTLAVMQTSIFVAPGQQIEVTGGYFNDYQFNFGVVPIYTVYAAPQITSTPTLEFIGTARILDFSGTNLDIENTEVTILYQRVNQSNSVVLSIPIWCAVSTISNTYIQCELDEELPYLTPADAGLGLVERLSTSLVSGGGAQINPGNTVIRRVVTPPIVTSTPTKVSTATKALAISGTGFGNSVEEVDVVLSPSGSCVPTIANSTFLVCRVDSPLLAGLVTAQVNRLSAPGVPNVVANAISPVQISNSSYGPIAKSLTIARSINITVDSLPDDTDVQVYIRLQYLSENEGFIGVTLGQTTATSISVSVIPFISGIVYATISTYGGNSTEVAVAYVTNDPYVSSVSSGLGNIARNAQFLTIKGSDFVVDSMPELVLRLYTGTLPYDVVLAQGRGELVNCQTFSITPTQLICQFDTPLSVPEGTQGFVWGSVFMADTLVAPGNVSFGGLVTGPIAYSSDFRYTQTVTSIQMKAKNINPLDLSIQLRDSSLAILPNQSCTLDLFRGIQPAATPIGAMQFYCNSEGILPVGELYASIFTYGVVETFRVGMVQAAAKIVPRQGYKRASTAQEIVIDGSGFISSPNHTMNVIRLGSDTPCEITSASDLQITCRPSQALPLGDLLAYVTVLGGTALPGNTKRVLNSEPFLLGTVVAPPALIPLDASQATISASETQITLHGSGFSSTPSDNLVTFAIPGSEVKPECTDITSSTETEIVCSISSLDQITATTVLKAQVQVFGGSTGLVDFVTVQSSTSSAIIAGVAAGVPIGIIAIAGAVVLVILLLRRKKQRELKSMLHKKAEAVQEKNYAEMSNMATATAREILQEWLVPLEGIEFGKQVGEGSFGKVFVGMFRGKKVAIKEALLSDPAKREEFFREAKLMCSLIPHKNVVQVLGVAVEDNSERCFIMMDYLYGSLDKIVYDSDNRQRLRAGDYIRYAKQVAAGMASIASQGVVHRDLACRNILLNKNGVAKISDFGMSRTLSSNQDTGKTVSIVGPIKWMSPEALTQIYSEKSDVWAYGALLVEMLTGDQPFGEDRDILEVALGVRDHGEIPPYPQIVPVLTKVLAVVFKQNPDDRPTFAEIVKMLGGEDD